MTIQFFKNRSLELKNEVQCYSSLNILAHAQLDEIEIGSRCGGHGICGGDRVLVLKGKDNLSPPTEIELHHFSSAEIQAGWRLACQTWPNSDQSEIHILINESASREDP